MEFCDRKTITKDVLSRIFGLPVTLFLRAKGDTPDFALARLFSTLLSSPFSAIAQYTDSTHPVCREDSGYGANQKIPSLSS